MIEILRLIDVDFVVVAAAVSGTVVVVVLVLLLFRSEEARWRDKFCAVIYLFYLSSSSTAHWFDL